MQYDIITYEVSNVRRGHPLGQRDRYASVVAITTTRRGCGGDRSVGPTAPHTGDEHVGFALPARGGCPARSVSFVCSAPLHGSSVVRFVARSLRRNFSFLVREWF